MARGECRPPAGAHPASIETTRVNQCLWILAMGRSRVTPGDGVSTIGARHGLAVRLAPLPIRPRRPPRRRLEVRSRMCGFYGSTGCGAWTGADHACLRNLAPRGPAGHADTAARA